MTSAVVQMRPEDVVAAGEKIYREKLRAHLENTSPGKFVAIVVDTGAYYLGDYPDQALAAAKAASPHGLVHLMRVGSEGAFKVSYSRRHAHRPRANR
jgi:hypothetical protein